MKRFFQKNKKVLMAAMMVVILSATFFIAPITARAQTVVPPLTNGGIQNLWQTLGLSNTGNSADSSSGCNPLSGFNPLTCILFVTSTYVTVIGVALLGWILGVLAKLLDFFLVFSLNSGNYSSITAIDTGWTIIRDLMNMVFIFVLLYSAICTILDIQQNYNVRKVLPRLIFAALFINFSLFITKVVIDGGNVVAREFYNRTIAGAPYDAAGGTGTSGAGGTSVRSMGALIVNKLNMGRPYDYDTLFGRLGNTPSALADSLTNAKSNQPILAGVMNIIVLIVAIYVMFQLAFIFFGRVIGFIFLMILSPIGFMGSVLPWLGGWSSKWREELIKQTIVAPVFLILLYIVVKISTQIQALNLDLILGNKTTIDIPFYFNYVVVIGMLIITMKITKQLAGELANKINDYGKKAVIAIAAIPVVAGTAVVAAAGAATVGAAAAGAAAGEGRVGTKLATMAVSKKEGWRGYAERFTGRTGIAAADRLGSASYDVRTTSGFQKLARTTGLATGAKTFGLSLTKKAPDDRKASETALSYRGREEERERRRDEEVKRLAKAVGSGGEENKIRAETAAIIAAEEAKKNQVEQATEKIQADKNDTKGDAYRKIKTQVSEETLAKDGLQTQLKAATDRERSIVGNSAAEKAEKAVAAADQQRIKTQLTEKTTRIADLNRKLNDEQKKLMGVVAGGMSINLDNIEQTITDAKTQMQEKIVTAKARAGERLETLEKQVMEGGRTQSVTEAAARGALKYGAAGAVIGLPVPGFGSATLGAAGAVVGSAGGAAKELFKGSRQTPAQREVLAEKIREFRESGRWKDRPKQDQGKGWAPSADVFQKWFKETATEEDKQKIKDTLEGK